jgi:hypothetical protein
MIARKPSLEIYESHIPSIPIEKLTIRLRRQTLQQCILTAGSSASENKTKTIKTPPGSLEALSNPARYSEQPLRL